MIRYPYGVVVGVNGADGGRAALAFAMREAAQRGSPLEVVTAWSRSDEGGDPGRRPGVDSSPEGSRQGAQQVQDRAVARTLREITARPVLSRQVVEGSAGHVLSRIARNADYLVVGGSTSGVESARSLGRVGDYCIRHAECAVVVVPADAVPVDDGWRTR